MNLSGNYGILMFLWNLGFPKAVKNGQLPIEFWECGIADKFSKVLFLKIHTFG